MNTKERVLELVRAAGPLTPAQAAETLGLGYERTKKAMQRMARAGELHTYGTGTYSTPVPHDDERDTGDGQRDTGPAHPDAARRMGEPTAAAPVPDRWEWQ